MKYAGITGNIGLLWIIIVINFFIMMRIFPLYKPTPKDFEEEDLDDE